MKMRYSLSLAVSLALQLGIPAAQGSELSCYKVRLAMDVGSGSTKMRSALVDSCEEKIVQLIVEKLKVDVSWREHVQDNVIDSEYINKAMPLIEKGLEELAAKTTDKLKTDPTLARYKSLATGDYPFIGGATATVRDSKNQFEFIQAVRSNPPEFHHKFDGKGLNIAILTQNQEGHLGYLGLFGALGDSPNFDANPSHFLSWDIGSVSMQIEGYYSNSEEGGRSWHDFGNELSSNSFTKKIIGVLGRSGSASPNPLVGSNDSDERLFSIAQGIVKSDPKIADLLKYGNWIGAQANKPGVKVYGIGGSHNGLLPTLKKVPGFENATGYTQSDLQNLIKDLAHLSDDEIVAKYKVKDKKFLSSITTNALYIYSVMSVLSIPRVEVADDDNALGMLVSPTLWGDKGDHPSL